MATQDGAADATNVLDRLQAQLEATDSFNAPPPLLIDSAVSRIMVAPRMLTSSMDSLLGDDVMDANSRLIARAYVSYTEANEEIKECLSKLNAARQQSDESVRRINGLLNKHDLMEWQTVAVARKRWTARQFEKRLRNAQVSDRGLVGDEAQYRARAWRFHEANANGPECHNVAVGTCMYKNNLEGKRHYPTGFYYNRYAPAIRICEYCFGGTAFLGPVDLTRLHGVLLAEYERCRERVGDLLEAEHAALYRHETSAQIVERQKSRSQWRLINRVDDLRKADDEDDNDAADSAPPLFCRRAFTYVGPEQGATPMPTESCLFEPHYVLIGQPTYWSCARHLPAPPVSSTTVAAVAATSEQ